MNKSTTQSGSTTLIASCQHLTKVRLSLDPQAAATEIMQVISNPCIPCFKAAQVQTRGITWAEINRSR